MKKKLTVLMGVAVAMLMVANCGLSVSAVKENRKNTVSTRSAYSELVRRHWQSLVNEIRFIRQHEPREIDLDGQQERNGHGYNRGAIERLLDGSRTRRVQETKKNNKNNKRSRGGRK